MLSIYICIQMFMSIEPGPDPDKEKRFVVLWHYLLAACRHNFMNKLQIMYSLYALLIIFDVHNCILNVELENVTNETFRLRFSV